jgi:hypothetical protein
MCVLAYSFDCRVGVDLEFHRPRSLQIAKRFYAKEERDWIWGCGNFETEAEKLNEFYRLWCRKEAFYKCAGGAFLGGTLSMNLLNSPIGGVFLYDFQGRLRRPMPAVSQSVRKWVRFARCGIPHIKGEQCRFNLIYAKAKQIFAFFFDTQAMHIQNHVDYGTVRIRAKRHEIDT